MLYMKSVGGNESTNSDQEVCGLTRMKFTVTGTETRVKKRQKWMTSCRERDRYNIGKKVEKRQRNRINSLKIRMKKNRWKWRE